MAFGLWRRRLTLRGLGVSLAVLTGGAIVLAGLSQLGWLAILSTHPESRVFGERDFYGRPLFMGGLYAVTAAAVLAVVPWFVRKFNASHLVVVSAGLVARGRSR